MTQEAQIETFREWALLELFGHQRIAGLVSEMKIGAGSFVRVDVPNEIGTTKFSKFFNPSAIYSITPVDRQIAIGLAVQMDIAPVTRWDVTKLASHKELGWEPEMEDNDDGL